jgi:cytoskeletal protein RodZ
VSDLGQLLKKARLEKGLSMEELEERTKIRKRYLEAIEEGDYKILPGNFYVRAFIKSYAETVGLDPNEVLGLYGNAIPKTTVEATAEPIRRKRSDVRRTEKLSKWASNILMLSFILLILGIIYYFIGVSYKGGEANSQVNPNDKITEKKPDELGMPTAQNEGGEGEPDSDSASLAPQQGASDGGQATPPPQQTPVVTLSRSEGNVDYYTATNADTLTVQLTVTGEECWLSIDKIVPATADRKQEKLLIEQKLYKKGDTREWVSDASVYINVGFPPAAQLTVNGVPIDLGQVKASKKVQIDLQKPAPPA